MSITGSIVVFVIIWWVIFFTALPIGIKHDNKRFSDNLDGIDPGAPKNPNVLKIFIHNHNNYGNFRRNILYSNK